MPAGDDGKLDVAVVAALYVEHGEELRRFLLGVLGDSQLASDVLQSTFARLLERGSETKEESRKAWLFRVAFHEAMAIRRRDAVGDKIYRKIAWQRGSAAESSASDGSDQPLLRFETVEQVREALAELPPDQHQIVRMRIYEEKTFAVIAEELQIPLGTALGRMRSAVMKLKAKLESRHRLG